MRSSSERIFRGIPASPGLSLGKVYHLQRGKIPIPRDRLKREDINGEVERFKKALQLSREQIKKIKSSLKKKGMSAEYLLILDAYIMLLKDNLLVSETIKKIKEEAINAEWAFSIVQSEFSERFHRLKNEYLKERVDDLNFVCNRVLRNLLKKEEGELDRIKEEVIIVAHYLSPADTAALNRELVKGIVTELGGRNSHTAIMARSLEIPAVVGIPNITEFIEPISLIIVNGLRGEVILDPTPAEIEEFIEMKNSFERGEKELLKLRDLPAITNDGVQIKLLANIDILEEVAQATLYGTEGIGMLRTEFLYMKRDELPDEEEHFSVYRNILKDLAPSVVTIRTLDLGGDKIAMKDREREEEEMNPALGFRAIRFCLENRDIFAAQLKGMLRASKYGNLRILIPMISTVEEIVEVRKLIQRIKDELLTNGEMVEEMIPLGVMLEVPSACLTCDIIAPYVDFFSIGTNDLIQYTLAIDRMNNRLSFMNEPHHPAILRLIKHVVDTAKRFDISISMCGEMAGDPLYVPFLIGMGIRELSMNMSAIPKVKRAIRMFTFAECEEIAKEVMKMERSGDILRFLEERFRRVAKENL